MGSVENVALRGDWWNGMDNRGLCVRMELFV
jgi:hypothetical protein